MSTPTVSQQIQALEREVGAPLFVRSSQGVDLTPIGAVFLDGCRATLTAADTALSTSRTAALNVVRLGVLNGANPVVPERIGAMCERLGVEVEAVAGSTADQVLNVVAGAVDIGLLRLPVEAPDSVGVMAIASEEFGFGPQGLAGRAVPMLQALGRSLATDGERGFRVASLAGDPVSELEITQILAVDIAPRRFGREAMELLVDVSSSPPGESGHRFHAADLEPADDPRER
ncbi:LysR family transcriptional regulator [Antrihabitans stalagmiti]|uniref:LysR family transcriptional regulator n=1 Tax=Antrihabitans stalagmiti TaxID=2799499 RepID=UPI001F31ED49|nr:LysR family transcriptional regulator [Antrihabitans stalagmiti]